MGRSPLELKYTERRLIVRIGLSEIMYKYESLRDSKAFTQAESDQLDTIYYKIQRAYNMLLKSSVDNKTFVGERHKYTITEEEE